MKITTKQLKRFLYPILSLLIRSHLPKNERCGIEYQGMVPCEGTILETMKTMFGSHGVHLRLSKRLKRQWPDGWKKIETMGMLVLGVQAKVVLFLAGMIQMHHLFH